MLKNPASHYEVERKFKKINYARTQNRGIVRKYLGYQTENGSVLLVLSERVVILLCVYVGILGILWGQFGPQKAHSARTATPQYAHSFLMPNIPTVSTVCPICPQFTKSMLTVHHSASNKAMWKANCGSCYLCEMNMPNRGPLCLL